MGRAQRARQKTQRQVAEVVRRLEGRRASSSAQHVDSAFKYVYTTDRIKKLLAKDETLHRALTKGYPSFEKGAPIVLPMKISKP